MLHWVNAQDGPIGPDHPECCPLIRRDLEWAHRQVSLYTADGMGAPYLLGDGGVLDQYERDLEVTRVISSELAKIREARHDRDEGHRP